MGKLNFVWEKNQEWLPVDKWGIRNKSSEKSRSFRYRSSKDFLSKNLKGLTRMLYDLYIFSLKLLKSSIDISNIKKFCSYL